MKFFDSCYSKLNSLFLHWSLLRCDTFHDLQAGTEGSHTHDKVESYKKEKTDNNFTLCLQKSERSYAEAIRSSRYFFVFLI